MDALIGSAVAALIERGTPKDVQEVEVTKIIFGVVCAEGRVVKAKFVGMIRKEMPS